MCAASSFLAPTLPPQTLPADPGESQVSIRPSERFLEGLRQYGVQFLLPCAEASAEGYYYWSWCMAAGLQEIGIPVYCNLPAILERHGISVAPDPCTTHQDTLVVADLSPFEQFQRACADLAQSVAARARRKAALCMADSVNYINFTPGFPTFVAHSVAKVHVQGLRLPWAFGLSREITDRVAAARCPDMRDPVFLRNFRPTPNQAVRNVLDLSFVKRLAAHVPVDRSFDKGPRHNADYFARLARSLGCLAYGGYFLEDLSWSGNAPAGHVLGDEPVIDRWDSWRFWESLASGCLTVSLDFDEYGFQLPVMPVNGLHYVGIRLDRIEDAVQLLTGPRDALAKIAENGCRWVMRHYAPAPAALLFLATMERIENGG